MLAISVLMGDSHFSDTRNNSLNLETKCVVVDGSVFMRSWTYMCSYSIWKTRANDVFITTTVYVQFTRGVEERTDSLDLETQMIRTDLC